MTDSQLQKEVQDSVRIPSTLKWVQKLKEHRALQRSRKREAPKNETLSGDSKAKRSGGFAASRESESSSIERPKRTHRRHRRSLSSSSESRDQRRRRSGRRKHGNSRKDVSDSRRDDTLPEPSNPRNTLIVDEVANPLSSCQESIPFSSSSDISSASSRHRRKPRSKQEHADLGDLLLLEDIMSSPSSSLTPSLPQTVKPFNTTLCQCKISILLRSSLISTLFSVSKDFKDNKITDDVAALESLIDL